MQVAAAIAPPPAQRIVAVGRFNPGSPKARKSQDVLASFEEHVSFFADFVPSVDVKAVKAKARAYWFRDGKNVDETQRLFQDLWHEAFTQINHVRKYFQILLDYDIDRMPWNIRRAFDQISAHCSDLFRNWQHRPARPLRRGLEPASLSTRVIALLYLLSVLLLRFSPSPYICHNYLCGLRWGEVMR
jgi:hypothetical protein